MIHTVYAVGQNLSQFFHGIYYSLLRENGIILSNNFLFLENRCLKQQLRPLFFFAVTLN